MVASLYNINFTAERLTVVASKNVSSFASLKAVMSPAGWSTNSSDNDTTPLANGEKTILESVIEKLITMYRVMVARLYNHNSTAERLTVIASKNVSSFASLKAVMSPAGWSTNTSGNDTTKANSEKTILESVIEKLITMYQAMVARLYNHNSTVERLTVIASKNLSSFASLKAVMSPAGWSTNTLGNDTTTEANSEKTILESVIEKTDYNVSGNGSQSVQQ